MEGIANNRAIPRILVVTFAYPPAVGGLPQQAHLLNRALRAHGIYVTVVTTHMDGFPDVDLLNGVPIFRLWTVHGGQKSFRFRIYPWLFPLTVFLFTHRREYDVIQVHQAMHPAALCIIIGKLLGKPTVIRNSGSGASGNVALLRKWWLLGLPVRMILRHADCLISLSRDITSELLEDGIPAENVVQIQNAVDTTFYAPVAQPSNQQGRKIVLAVGRFTEEKGFDILVRAWAKVAIEESDAKLVIVGDGVELPALETLAQQLGIRSTVSFEGNQEDVLTYLSQADIFVLPSRNEGMSNALLEAMSVGRACIASDIPANLEVVEPEVDALVFKKDDADDLAARIIQLLRDPERIKQLGENARRTIVGRFSIDHIAELYIKLYSQLFADRYLKT